MKMLKLDELGAKEKLMLLAACIAVCGFLLSLLSLPFVSKLKDIDRETGGVLSQLNMARSLIACDQPVSAEYQKVEARLGRSLSDAESIGDIKEDIELMARDAGLTFDPPSHRDPVVSAGSPWREYTVELPRCEGGMDALLAFIGAVENSALVYRIEKLSLAPAKTGAGVTATVVISRIMLPPEELPAGAEESM